LVRLRAQLPVVLAVLLLCGCAEPSADAAALHGTTDARRPVVIAILDTGTNPYLATFQSDEDVSAFVPAQFEIFPLSRHGTPRERAEADDAQWQAAQLRTLYYFEGTRIFSISFAQDGPPVGRDGSRHGAVTTYLAAREAPGAVIVSVQAVPAACLPRDLSCFVNTSVAEGMEWIADQPWIDIVSISFNVPANPPVVPAAHAELARFIAASERAAASGKTILNSAGNYVMTPATDVFAGAPWIVTVGGAESRSQGEALVAAKGVDVVANFTDLAPAPLSEDLEYRSGTSFATPIVAGTLAHALHLVREAEPERVVTPQELRDALNASATYFDAASWRPTWSDQDPLAPLFEASLPVLAQPQMGWGYVDGGLAPEVARRVLENDLAPPPEKAQAMLFQAQWQKAREEYWKSWPRR